MFRQANIHPHAGKSEVLAITEQLFQKHWQTTTLEVKIALRQRGYLAYQEEISYWMDQLAEELDWPFTCNGRFRTYYPVVPEDDWYENLLKYCRN